MTRTLRRPPGFIQLRLDNRNWCSTLGIRPDQDDPVDDASPRGFPPSQIPTTLGWPLPSKTCRRTRTYRPEPLEPRVVLSTLIAELDSGVYLPSALNSPYYD